MNIEKEKFYWQKVIIYDIYSKIFLFILGKMINAINCHKVDEALLTKKLEILMGAHVCI